MHALPIMIAVLCVLAIAYRYYSAFLAARVAVLDDTRLTPAHALKDGQNYHPTNKWVLFGHHFAAISGAGPLIGPVLAIQFGYMPGLLWLVIGVCLAGAVQDFLVLAASMKHKGRSLAQIARDEIGPISGSASILAILFIIIVALAGLGATVVKALGGEEVALPAMTQIILPERAVVGAGRHSGSVHLPEKTRLIVPSVVKGDDGVTRTLQREYPVSIAQDLACGESDLAALQTSSNLKLSSPAKLLIPGSSWGVFTIGMSIPIALLMGLWIYVFRKKSHYRIVEASAFGVITLLACVQIGSYVPQSWLGPWLDLNRDQIIVAMAIYGFVASVLPVWLLLCPRDYLSSYLKIGTIAALIIGVLWVNPKLEMPMYENVWQGDGPNFKGQLFPFLFITLMCGAISGFHALVSSGTTPKMIEKESHCRPIGYGAMLLEGLVGIVALIAASSLHWGDYLAINVPAAKFAALGVSPVNLQELSTQVGEQLQGRTGGGVTLAVGMAQIFSGIPGLSHLMDFWYHFAVMFEALFVLTTIDTGTRVARYLVQEFGGALWKPFARTDWLPGTLISTSLVVAGWGSMLWNNSISEIWPMFGVANQLLATCALAIATVLLVNEGKRRYAWITAAPLAFLTVTTLSAGVMNITLNFWPKYQQGIKPIANLLNCWLTALMIVCVVTVIVNALLTIYRVLSGKIPASPATKATLAADPPIDGCC